MNLTNPFLLTNKVIIVTGGCGLLGKQFSRVIAKFKGIPVLLDKNISQEKKIVAEIYKNFNIKPYVLKCDITKETSVKEALKKILKKYKKKNIFGLINNAAYNPQPKKNKNSKEKLNSFENYKLYDFNKEFEVGILGSIICSKIFGSYFSKRKKGTIINISSDLGIIAPDQRIYHHLNYIKPVSYSVIKHGIIGLTKYIASYWGDKGVTCNTISPGGVENNQSIKFIKKIEKLIPLGRMASTSDFDGIIIYLLSDYSRYMNGALIPIDGGRTII